jgi:hypothetical protein
MAESPSPAPEESSAAPISPGSIRLFYQPPGTVRLSIGEERSYPTVRVYQAWPLSQPGRHISFLDGNGEEIVMLDDLDGLEPESRSVAEEELRRRYLTARIEAIAHIRTEFGVTYWHVETHRGPRDFVVQSLSESCQWLSEHHLLIMDVDGNRFDIPDRRALDPKSAAQLDAVL